MFIDHGNDIFGKSSAQYLQAKFLFPVIGDANMWGFFPLAVLSFLFTSIQW